MDNGIDIFTSRRKNFDKCLFWHRLDDEDLSSLVSIDPEYGELIYDRNPDGTFFANEISPFSYESKSLAGGTFMFDSTNVGIETNDDIQILSQNDLVFYDGDIWRVSSLQRTKYKKQNQYSKKCGYKTIIMLRR